MCGHVQVKSSKLSVQGSVVTVGSSLPKKRSLRDRQDTSEEPVEEERPRKRHSALAAQLEEAKQRNGVNSGGSEETRNAVGADPKIPIDIQAMLASTRKQIEERRKQTESLLVAQKQASEISQAQSGQEALHLGSQATKPSIAAVIQQQKEMLQQQGVPVGGPQQTSIHPHAYHREIQLAYGATAGPSALDQALKNAEVSRAAGKERRGEEVWRGTGLVSLR